MFSEYAPFTGEMCFLAARHDPRPAKAKVVVNVHGPLVDLMAEVGNKPLLSGERAEAAKWLRLDGESGIITTMTRYGLTGYIGFEWRKH